MALTQNREMFGRRINDLRNRLAGHRDTDVDTAWIVQPENRRYLSGFKATDTQFTESSGSLLVTAEKTVLITDSRYTTEARMEAPGFDVLTLKRDLETDLPDILHTIGTRTLGFEGDYLTWGTHRRLAESLGTSPNAIDLVPLPPMLEDMREIKDDRELDILRDAANLISHIFDTVINTLEPGMTEKEVARRIESLAISGGAEALSFPSIVASGPNSALPHAVPTNRRLRAAEPVIIDAGVRLNGYCSDMTRTVFIGPPNEPFRDIYKIIKKAQSTAIKMIQPLVSTTEVDGAARDIIKGAGYGEYFGHGLGHGVGLATHERPRLGPRKPVLLKAGMVVTVEPGIYLPEKGGIRLEEMVVVTDTGAEILTRNQNVYDFE